MQNITIQGTEILLKDTPMEIRYQESKEWLDTLTFKQEEMAFLGDLLINKILQKGMRSEYGQMIEDLGKIHRNLFDYLEDDIIAHEKLLATSVRAHKYPKPEAHTQHHTLKERMKLLTEDLRAFKKTVFKHVKNL